MMLRFPPKTLALKAATTRDPAAAAPLAVEKALVPTVAAIAPVKAAPVPADLYAAYARTPQYSAAYQKALGLPVGWSVDDLAARKAAIRSEVENHSFGATLVRELRKPTPFFGESVLSDPLLTQSLLIVGGATVISVIDQFLDGQNVSNTWMVFLTIVGPAIPVAAAMLRLGARAMRDYRSDENTLARQRSQALLEVLDNPENADSVRLFIEGHPELRKDFARFIEDLCTLPSGFQVAVLVEARIRRQEKFESLTQTVNLAQATQQTSTDKLESLAAFFNLNGDTRAYQSVQQALEKLGAALEELSGDPVQVFEFDDEADLIAIETELAAQVMLVEELVGQLEREYLDFVESRKVLARAFLTTEATLRLECVESLGHALHQAFPHLGIVKTTTSGAVISMDSAVAQLRKVGAQIGLVPHEPVPGVSVMAVTGHELDLSGIITMSVADEIAVLNFLAGQLIRESDTIAQGRFDMDMVRQIGTDIATLARLISEASEDHSFVMLDYNFSQLPPASQASVVARALKERLQSGNHSALQSFLIDLEVAKHGDKEFWLRYAVQGGGTSLMSVLFTGLVHTDPQIKSEVALFFANALKSQGCLSNAVKDELAALYGQDHPALAADKHTL